MQPLVFPEGLDIQNLIDVPYPVSLAFGEAPKASMRKGVVINNTEAVKAAMHKPRALRTLEQDGMPVLPNAPMERFLDLQNKRMERGELTLFAQESDLLIKHPNGSLYVNPTNGGDLMRMMREVKQPSFSNALRMPKEFEMISCTASPSMAGKAPLYVDDVEIKNGIISIQGEVDKSRLDPDTAKEMIEKYTLEALDLIGLDYGTVEFALSSEGLFVADVHSKFMPGTESAVNSLIQYQLKKRGKL